MRGPLSWVLALSLVATVALPAASAYVHEHREEEDILLVGVPVGQGVHVAPDRQGTVADVRPDTARVYTVDVPEEDNRLRFDLRYDAGPRIQAAPCPYATDLDVSLHGPDGPVTVMDGCDAGRVVVIQEDVPAGEYEVRVWADRGTTLCLGVENLHMGTSQCDHPEVRYAFDLWVHLFDLGSEDAAPA